MKQGNVSRKAGINFSGKKTSRNRGFINKRKLRNVDYFRAFWHVKYVIISFDFDPNRKSILSLVQYFNQSFSYIISIEGLKLFNVFMDGNFVLTKWGSSTVIKNIKKGFKVSNIETYLLSGSKLLRSKGSVGKLVSKNKKNCKILLRSKKIKKVKSYCTCVYGSVLNFNFNLGRYKKASYNRYRGFRPTVRGVAMNPVDHPHGGGEGKKSKKKNPMSPWGKKLNFVKR